MEVPAALPSGRRSVECEPTSLHSVKALFGSRAWRCSEREGLCETTGKGLSSIDSGERLTCRPLSFLAEIGQLEISSRWRAPREKRPRTTRSFRVASFPLLDHFGEKIPRQRPLLSPPFPTPSFAGLFGLTSACAPRSPPFESLSSTS